MARPIYGTPPPEMLQYSPILEECVLLVNLVNPRHSLRNTCTLQMVLEPNGYMLRCENIQADLRLSISHGSITLPENSILWLLMLLNLTHATVLHNLCFLAAFYQILPVLFQCYSGFQVLFQCYSSLSGFISAEFLSQRPSVQAWQKTPPTKEKKGAKA